MLVLVGRVTSATSFDPTYAAIIQNKAQGCLSSNGGSGFGNCWDCH